MKYSLKYLLIILFGFVAAIAEAKETIRISLVNQQLYLYQDNKIIFSTRISTGRKSMATPQTLRDRFKENGYSRPGISYDVTLLYAAKR